MCKILLIGNKESRYEALIQQLSPYGYDLRLSTEGGDQGIITAIKESPDLILVDSDIAIINGWQVIRILKTSTVTQLTPVIALMSPDDQTAWQMILQSDCDDYCLKPVSLLSLLNKFETILGHTNRHNQGTHDEALASLSQNLVFQKKRQAPVSPHPSPAKTKKASSTRATGKKPLVVYIEDRKADSLVMAKIVQDAGYGYANITHPLNALPQLLELKPQLIFLDLVMSLVNGYELCAQIRRVTLFKATPIVIVTTNDGIADRVRAKVVGASGFLGKPIKSDRVQKVLTKYLNSIKKDYLDSAKQEANLVPLF